MPVLWEFTVFGDMFEGMPNLTGLVEAMHGMHPLSGNHALLGDLYKQRCRQYNMEPPALALTVLEVYRFLK